MENCSKNLICYNLVFAFWLKIKINKNSYNFRNCEKRIICCFICQAKKKEEEKSDCWPKTFLRLKSSLDRKSVLGHAFEVKSMENVIKIGNFPFIFYDFLSILYLNCSHFTFTLIHNYSWAL